MKERIERIRTKGHDFIKLFISQLFGSLDLVSPSLSLLDSPFLSLSLLDSPFLSLSQLLIVSSPILPPPLFL